MKKVAITTDSVAYMPEETAKEHDITLISTHVVIDGKTNYETELDLNWFYSKMFKWKEEDRLPTTSSPSTDDYLKVFRSLSQAAESIICLAYSSKLGMAASAASQAKAKLQDELPDTRIEIIDVQSACGPQILIAVEASRAAAAGKELPEILDLINDLIYRMNHILISDNLYYLAKGGRIHRARPWASSRITNSVILEMDTRTNGEHAPLARCRTKGDIMQTVMDLIDKRGGGKKLHFVISHADVPAEAEELREIITGKFDCAEVYMSRIGPLVTTHVGLGTRMLSWWAEE